MDRAIALFGQLLRLRLVVVGNGFRQPLPAFARVAAALALVTLAALTTRLLVDLGARSEWQLHAASVALGTMVFGVCLFLPAAVVRDEPLHARGFAGYGLPASLIAVLVPITDLVSLPCLLLAVLLVGYVGSWAAVGVGGIAFATALVLLILGLQAVRLSSIVGARLWRARRGPIGRAVAWAALAALGILCLVPMVGDPAGIPVRILPVVELLRFTGIGLLWDAPHLELTEVSGWPIVAAGAVAILVLAILQFLFVRSELRGGRTRRGHASLDRIGIFRLAQGSPTAAVAARSTIYWIRDPRYAASLIALPFVPVLMLAAASIGGVPGDVIGLVPLPIVVLILGWSSTHNDTAYDSTAIWAHVVAPLRGIQDRIGRAVPVLAIGVLVIALGTPLTVLAVDRRGTVLVVLGLCGAALLGSVGVGSGVSARFPYAVSPPGSSAFRAPQAASSAGGAAQTLSVAAVVLVIAPAVWATVMWTIHGGAWAWAALGLGVGVGALVLVAGLLLGGWVFDRRTPELLDFAMRN